MHQTPFFGDEHRKFLPRLEAFVRTTVTAGSWHDETATHDMAAQYVRALCNGGWLKTIDPADIRTACLIRERLAYASSLADTMFAMQGLGGLPIAMYGTAQQKRQWFSRIQRGAIGAFALTEPDAGSDPAGMKLAATRTSDSYALTGEKTFISNAGLADIYVVFARLDTGDSHAPSRLASRHSKARVARSSDGLAVPNVRSDKSHDELPPTRDDPSFIALIVPGDARGLSAEPIRLIAPHPMGTLRFDHVRVPASQRLGGEGDGLRIALGTLDRFRPTVGAAACGMARRALDEALVHVQQREQFGRPLARFQAVQFMLAEMATELAAAQLLVARAAWMVDLFSRDRERRTGADANEGRGSAGPEKGTKARRHVSTKGSTITTGDGQSAFPNSQSEIKQAVSMAKLFATDQAQMIIDKAVQLFGGRGLVHGHPVERLYREVRALRIYEGTSEIQKLVIARTLLDGP